MAQRIINVHLKLLFHFYKSHKNIMTEFRIWFVARHVIDNKGSGKADIKKISRVLNLQPPYIRRICNNSSLFISIHKNDIYYVSIHRLIEEHELSSKGFTIRGEKINTRYRAYFASKKNFVGYITKCFVENDLNHRFKKRQITKGRIGTYKIAECLNISRTTVISNIKISDAKLHKHIIEHKNINFRTFDEYKNGWLLENMDRIVGGYRIGNNLNSYFLKKDYARNIFYLTQTLPHFYEFTGIYLVHRRQNEG